MQSKFFDTISKHKMLTKTEDVVLAVSGGSDSVCLLLLMIDFYGEDYKNHIICAHYNHMIRGIESDADELLVRNLCEKYDIRFVVQRGNIPEIAAQRGLGLEECARNMRYEFLNNVSMENGGLKIAIAHNKNDNVETIIGNIARGTSINGLKGISYCRDKIIRPLLDYSKEEINNICKNAGVQVAFDSTNTDNSYKRNNIRNVVLPFLRENLSGQIDDKILSLSEAATCDNSFIEEEAKKAFGECSNISEDSSFVFLNTELFDTFHDAIKYRIIRMCLASLIIDEKPVFPEYVNIDRKAVLRILSGIQAGRSGKTYDALSDIVCITEYDRAVFMHKNATPSTNNLSLDVSVRSVLEGEYKKLICEKNPFVEYFDYDKIHDIFVLNSNLEYRTIKEGDIFHPFGAKGSKSLRRFYIDEKIPQSERQVRKNVCIGNNVLWVPGLRRSDIARIDETTLNVLVLRVI